MTNLRLVTAEVIAKLDTQSAKIEKDGTGSEPPDMESRIAKLEAWAQHSDTTLTEIKSDIREMRRDMRGDFRLIFGSLIAVALGLAGLIAKGFHWL